MRNTMEQQDLAEELRTEGELDRDAALHFAEDALRHGPVHCVLEAAFYLGDVFVCEVGGGAERFVQVWSADVEFGDHVAAAEHGVCYCYRWGEGAVGACVVWWEGGEWVWRVSRGWGGVERWLVFWG